MSDYIFIEVNKEMFFLSRQEEDGRGEFVYDKTVAIKYGNIDYCELFVSKNDDLSYDKKIKIKIKYDTFFLIDEEAEKFWKNYKSSV